MSKFEYEQLCAVIDALPSGTIPPQVTGTTLPGGAKDDYLKSAAAFREIWPPLQVPLVSREQVKKLMQMWVTDVTT